MEDQQPHEAFDHTDQCETFKKQCEEYKAGWQRAQADYQNLQRETARQRSEWAMISELQVIEEFIPVYGNLKKALEHTNHETYESTKYEKDLIKGIEMVQKQFADILKQHGVEEMKTVGQSFDPIRHEALQEEVSEEEEGTILREVDSGYLMKDRVIKPAKVIVAKKAE